MPRILTVLLVAAMAMTLAPAASAGTTQVREIERLYLRHLDVGDSCASPRYLSATPAANDLECGWGRNTSTVVEAYSIRESMVLDAMVDATGRLEIGTHSSTPGYGQYGLSVSLRARTADGFVTIGSADAGDQRAVSVVDPDVIFNFTIDVPDELDGTEISELTFEFTQSDSIQVNHGYVRKDEAESYVDLPIIREVEQS